MEIYLLLLLPVVTAALSGIAKERKWQWLASLAGSLGIMFWVVWLTKGIFGLGPKTYGHEVFYLDALNGFMLLILAFVNLCAVLFSWDYFNHELEHRKLNHKQLGFYHFWYFCFVFTMLLALVVNNMGLMWVAIEGTTLASALLVGLYNRKEALEAAWKYVLLCSVGITFALLGIILTYYAANQVFQVQASLNLVELTKLAPAYDAKIMKLAFIFVLIGYGTKMGLAPMHTWLPDAHSQAPTPVSALLSAVLLNCAFYGIIRFYTITGLAVGYHYPQGLLLIFGLLTIVIALPFIGHQLELKRLLAYSSVENMGIIAVGFGLGGKLALTGAVMHILNHSLAKSLFFFSSGAVIQAYHTTKIGRIRGALKQLPSAGVFFLVAGLALSGVPPFSIFMSEINIIMGGFQNGNYMAAFALALLLALAFTAILYHLLPMAFGQAPRFAKPERRSFATLMSMALPAAFVVLLGLYWPNFYQQVLAEVTAVIGGI